jgi:hypothetical protein
MAFFRWRLGWRLGPSATIEVGHCQWPGERQGRLTLTGPGLTSRWGTWTEGPNIPIISILGPREAPNVAAPAGTQGRCPAGSQSCRSRPFGQSRSLPSGWGHWHSKCQVAASSTGEAQPYPREGFTHWRSLRHIDCNESNMAAERVTTVGLPKAWLIESSCKDASMAGCAIEVASGPEPTTG